MLESLIYFINFLSNTIQSFIFLFVLKTWDCESGKRLLNSAEAHDGEVTVASFFDNDKRIVTASKDGSAKVEKAFIVCFSSS